MLKRTPLARVSKKPRRRKCLNCGQYYYYIRLQKKHNDMGYCDDCYLLFNSLYSLPNRQKPLKRTPLCMVTPKQQVKRQKRAIIKNYMVKNTQGICPNCGKPFTEINPPDLDHIKQLGKGGDDDESNLRILCRNCHNKRHNGTKDEQNI